MILRFKAGSEAEATVRSLVENRDASHEYARSIIEEITGVKPFGFGYHWFFSISFNWSWKHIGFEIDSPEEIPGLKFKREHEGIRYFEANKRSVKGKVIIERFQTDQQKLRTDSEILKKFGIYTEKESWYSDYGLGSDEKGVWMSISSKAFENLEFHPDVFLESKIPTAPAN